MLEAHDGYSGSTERDYNESALEIIVLQATLKAERQRCLELQSQLDEVAVLKRVCAEQRHRLAEFEENEREELRLLRQLSTEQRERLKQLENEKDDWLARASSLAPLFEQAAALLAPSPANQPSEPKLRLAS